MQSVTLLLPPLFVLGLVTLGIALNIATFVLLLVIATVLYIGVGQRVRRLTEAEQQNWQDPSTTNETQGSSAAEAAEASETNTTASISEQDSRSRWEESATGDQSRSSSGGFRSVDASGMPWIDQEAIQQIFSVDSFFATETIPYGQGVIFRGNLRVEPQVALDRLTEQLQRVMGDRYRLFLVEDTQGKPAVVVLPDTVVNQKTSQGAKWLAVGLLIASFLALLEVGANLAGFRLLDMPGRWPEALPVAAGILTTLMLHEVGHRWMAGNYGVRLSPAFMIPALGIGTLGTLNRIESPLPNRKALFDIALAGPAVGGLISLVILILGLTLSGQAGEIYVPATLFRSSTLVASLASLIMGPALQADVVAIHPLVAVGWIGTGITALSLLPAGQLDGGRIVQAVYGRRTGNWATLITLVVLAFTALSNVIALYWALLILFIAREPERPPLNEIDETDERRDALALLALFLMIMTLLPVTPILDRFLQIG